MHGYSGCYDTFQKQFELPHPTASWNYSPSFVPYPYRSIMPRWINRHSKKDCRAKWNHPSHRGTWEWHKYNP